MSAFEEWHKKFEHKVFNSYWHRKAGWKAALEWALNQETDLQATELGAAIKEELENEH